MQCRRDRDRGSVCRRRQCDDREVLDSHLREQLCCSVAAFQRAPVVHVGVCVCVSQRVSRRRTWHFFVRARLVWRPPDGAGRLGADEEGVCELKYETCMNEATNRAHVPVRCALEVSRANRKRRQSVIGTLTRPSV
eukprot:4930657-Prymnesium_polylepis.1